MCRSVDDIDGGPGGRLRAAVEWFRRMAGPEPEPGPGRLSDEEIAAARAGIQARALLKGERLCRRCMAVLGTEPGETCGLLDRTVCWSCDSRWVESHVILPLIEVLGRKAARRALKRLVDRVDELNSVPIKTVDQRWVSVGDAVKMHSV